MRPPRSRCTSDEVWEKVVQNRFLLSLAAALIALALSACGDRESADDRATPVAANAAPPAPVADTAAPSDIQQWAAQQTGAASPHAHSPAAASTAVSAVVSAALLPPVIHEAE
jgi:hypothetical protein